MYLMKGMAVLAMGLVVASCNKLDFANQAQVSDEEALENAEMQLGAEIDPNQDWKMTKEVQGTVNVNLGTGKDYTLLMFDKNPFVNDDAVYYLKQTITDGSNSTYNVAVPSAQKQLYVTLIDNNNYSVSKYVFFDDNVFSVDLNATANARAMRRANAGENYANTSDGINANANEWADVADAPHGHGGWLVPRPLTNEQKEVVRKYFQANPGPGYEDPHFRHFFVQQVYKGGTSVPTTGNKEDNVAADGTTHYNSDNMNLLTVGKNEQHINNFNGGTYSGQAIQVDGQTINPNEDGTVNVLDSAHTVNEFAEHHHPDQIMLMVNIDDTECMGYFNTGSSQQKNDKAKLVGWQTIRTWANNNNLNGDCLNDGWNRSFVGFDFELYNLEQSYLKDENGNKIYAQFTDGQNSALQYVWTGTEILKKATQSAPRRSAKAKRARRAGTTYVDIWTGNESKSNNTPLNVTFSDAAKELLVEGNYLGVDLSVSEGSEWKVKFLGQWMSDLSIGEISLNSNTTNVEIQLTATDAATLLLQNLGVWSTANPINFTRVYISEYSQANGTGNGTNNGGNTDNNNNNNDNNNTQNDDNLNTYTGGNYLVVNGKQIPFFIANTNMYGGTKRTISDDDMKIEKDGRWCFNMETIADLVGEGYLPVKDTNLRDWVKWQGGDGYYSDWIVTLTEAKRQSDTQTHEEEINPQPNVWSYAFEDTMNGDYDMNDVVLKVKENEDGENIDVWLVAAGATLDLTIKLYEYDANNTNGEHPYYGNFIRTLEYNGQTEIHLMWDVDPGTMVNTNAGANKAPIRIAQLPKSEGYEADKLRFTINSKVWEVFLAGSGQAPYGVMIPWNWKWPTERTRITKAYNNKNTQETEADQSFTNFMSNAGHAELWYKYPTGSVVSNVTIPE